MEQGKKRLYLACLAANAEEAADDPGAVAQEVLAGADEDPVAVGGLRPARDRL